MSVTDDDGEIYYRSGTVPKMQRKLKRTGIEERTPTVDDTGNMGFTPKRINELSFTPRRDIRKVDGVPVITPDDIRTMASDALKMQDALIRIQSILKRPAPSHQSLAMHHAYMIRDIHKAVNLPEPDSVKRVLGE